MSTGVMAICVQTEHKLAHKIEQFNNRSLFFYKRNFIKDESAPEDTGSIQNDANTERTKKTRETRKKTHKDPTIAENPKHPNKNPKTLYNITSQQPPCFCSE